MKTDNRKPLKTALAADAGRTQATPLEVFKLARHYWLEGKRISIGELAKTVGVSRVTLYRWVGSKERLVEEVLWSFAKPTFKNAIKASPGNGVEHIVDVHRRFMTAIADFAPMRRFLMDHPTAAIRIQSCGPGGSHVRLIELAAVHIGEQASHGHLQLTVPARELAELIVFTNGSLLYGAIIGGRSPITAIKQACIIDRVLLQGSLS